MSDRANPWSPAVCAGGSISELKFLHLFVDKVGRFCIRGLLGVPRENTVMQVLFGRKKRVEQQSETTRWI
jgi:hypothetical protein